MRVAARRKIALGGLAAAAALLLLLLLANNGACRAQEDERVKAPGWAEVGEARAAYKLPKLFDFEHFKRLFGKTYGSLAEELARKRLFFARAFTAFVTGLQYKFRRMSYFLAVNYLSDQSRDELQRTRNKRLAEARRREMGAGATREFEQELAGEPAAALPEFIPAPYENVEAEVVQLIEAHKHEPGFEELAREMALSSSARRKRSTGAAVERPRPPREFSFDQLIASGEQAHAQARARDSPKMVREVEGNNPEYEPFELVSLALSDTERTKWVTVRKEDERPFYAQARSYLGSLLWKAPEPTAGQEEAASLAAGAAADNGKRDLMFVDLNLSDCLSTPRKQYNCGSCYAFAAVAIMEFQYCIKRGKLVELSEQYMIDCGNGRFGDDLSGCDGATDEAVADFLHNFGLETRKHFPYTGRDGKCPYEEDMDIKRTGYIRMPIEHVARIPADKWPEVLPHGPLYLGMAAGDDMQHYGGGVYDGRGCEKEDNHAVVLVGHGREDGEEFWLIRNSYGPAWGVFGHLKLAKSATRKCIETQSALAFGSKDGIHYNVEPTKSRPSSTATSGQPRAKPAKRAPRYTRNGDAILSRDELRELMSKFAS